jgi:hypothetical protein
MVHQLPDQQFGQSPHRPFIAGGRLEALDDVRRQQPQSTGVLEFARREAVENTRRAITPEALPCECIIRTMGHGKGHGVAIVVLRKKMHAPDHERIMQVGMIGDMVFPRH